MLEIVPSNAFKKDLKRAKKRGQNLDQRHRVLRSRAAGEALAEKHRTMH